MDALLMAAAILGLTGLVAGVSLVNVVSTPRFAQIGGLVTGIAVILLALVAAALLAGHSI